LSRSSLQCASSFELLSHSKPSCVAQNLDAHLSDCQTPAIVPVVRPLRRSCTGCLRRRTAMQVLSCHCQARARISSCLRCRRWPGVHAVSDRVPVWRECSRQNRGGYGSAAMVWTSADLRNGITLINCGAREPAAMTGAFQRYENKTSTKHRSN
jgi:hypothetical protein